MKRFWVLFNRRAPKPVPHKIFIEPPSGQSRWDELEEILCDLPMAGHHYNGGDDFLYVHLVPRTQWMLKELPKHNLPISLEEVSSELEKAGFRVLSTQKLD